MTNALMTNTSVLWNSGRGGIRPEAQQYLDRAGLSGEPDDGFEIVQFIDRACAYGLWDKCAAAWWMAAPTSFAARTELRGRTFTQGSTLIEVSSPTFVAQEGYSFNGSTSYLKTPAGLSPKQIGLQSNRLSADKCHYAFWSKNNVGPSSGAVFGASEPGKMFHAFPLYGDGNSYLRIASDEGPGTVMQAASSSELFQIGRSDNDVHALWNGAYIAAPGGGDYPDSVYTDLPDVDIYFGANNSNGTATSFAGAIGLGFVWFGVDIDSSEMQALSSIVSSYLGQISGP